MFLCAYNRLLDWPTGNFFSIVRLQIDRFLFHFLWNSACIVFYSSARNERSMHQGIILAYNNKFPEGVLSELKLTTEEGCLNNGFGENDARKTEQHGDTPIVSPG